MISEKVVAAVSPICCIYANDAETHTAPYATYSINEETIYDKDGPSAVRADVDLLIVATTFDKADDIADRVVSAIGSLRSQMPVKLLGREPYESTDAKLFAVGLSYQITEEVD